VALLARETKPYIVSWIASSLSLIREYRFDGI
jgi:hypothetical protein